MLKSVELIEWVQLVIALILFLGPGALLGHMLRAQPRVLLAYLVLFTTLSAVFWILLLNYLRLLGVFILNTDLVLGLSILSWVIYLYGIRKQLNRSMLSSLVSWETIRYGVICLASLLILMYSIRRQVAGLGSDSLHHTLISQLIVWNGGLPNNYAPAYPDIITLKYHTGFHIVTAVITLLSGWQTRLVVLMMLPLLVVFSGCSIAYFVKNYSNDQYSPWIAAWVSLFLFAFPVGMLEWGRYPQTLGLILLAVFLTEYLRLTKEAISLREVILIALLGAGIAYTHYRVSIMTVTGIILWESWRLFPSGLSIRIKSRMKNLAEIAIVGGILLVPLFVNIIRTLNVGYSDPIPVAASSFFNFNRLGSDNITYTPNYIALAMFVLSLILLIIKKDELGLWLFAWWLGLIIFSVFIGWRYFDPVTILSSLYIPIAILIGLGFSKIIPRFTARSYITLVPLAVALMFFGGIFMFKKATAIVPAMAFVTREDVEAAEWIASHLPAEGCFMINTLNFDFSPKFIIGSDGGGWLPVLAQRCVITYPMTSIFERFDHPQALDKIVSLHQLNGQLDSEYALKLMHAYNIRYVYVSTQNVLGESHINPKKLNESPNFGLLYKNRSVYVFEILYP